MRKYGPGNVSGFDHVFLNPDGTVTLLVDSKQMNRGAVSINPDSAGGFPQLSDKWVETVLDSIDKNSDAYKYISNAIRDNRLSKGIAAIDKSSGNVVIIRLK